MVSGERPRVFNIPASQPFLPVLVKALLAGEIVPGFPSGDPKLALASATLYLPTRRACRLAREAFLDALGGEAALLPRIAALGDIDEDEIAFSEVAAGIVPEDALALPVAIGGYERLFLLAQLVRKWADRLPADDGARLIADTPAAIIALANELARFIDDVSTRRVDWNKLDTLVPEEFDAYWQMTLAFLQAAREDWPDMLRKRGAIDPARQRDLLIDAEAKRLARHTGGPVIAAGSTGSMPATADLLAAIALLPHGAVILPGLDTHLDAPSWKLILKGDSDSAHPLASHPQFSLAGLLTRIGIARDDVRDLARPAPHGRETLLSEALRPAGATELWREQVATRAFAAGTAAALKTVTVIEAAHSEEESLAIAIVLREHLEQSPGPAALITPDRALARRVLAALARWNVAVDDSGGDPLADIPAGIFAQLAADICFGESAPAQWLALLKHPLCRLDADSNAQAVAILERALFRGPRPGRGTAALAAALSHFEALKSGLHRRDPRSALTASEIAMASDLIARLANALAPLETLKGMHQLSHFAAQHREALAAIAGSALETREGEALLETLDDIATAPASATLALTAQDYPETIRALFAQKAVRRPGDSGARIRILGPLEARLQSTECVVLGGMAEGVWPPQPRGDAWLSRPMRHDLGLDLPERRVGLSAHDFAQAMGAPRVVLTRASKIGGAPVIASRLMQRLAAVAGDAWKDATARGQDYLRLARALDSTARELKPKRPEPRPPLAARPKAMSVTDIENWLRDPYTIYAKHVLRLAPLDPVDTPPGAGDRGSMIHDAIGDLTKAHPDGLPPDAETRLLAIGREKFAAFEDFPEARAFWWPRFVRIAQWYVAWARGRAGKAHAEISGKFAISPDFTLSARADRIEQLPDGRFNLIDFKTGKPPTEPQVRSGLSPQLTLEGALLIEGGFGDLGKGVPADVIYVRLNGADPAGDEQILKFKEGGDATAQSIRALDELRKLVASFENPDQPYVPLVVPQWRGRHGDYDHLARVKEWSDTGGETEGEAE